MELSTALNISLIAFYYLMLTYFEEFLTARHPFFKKNLRIGIIQEFGRSKIYYRSKAIREFYTIVKYRDNNVDHIVKISRCLDDCVGKEIILAVGKNNTAVRYEKCKWYAEEEESSPKIILGLIAFVLIIFNIMIVCFGKIKQVYPIFLSFMIIHYLCLPVIIRLRNSLWNM
ncbi:MAG: hypothetical protein HDR01_01470 [Lachnospiraceae bacterium]|nr:hypothetical protein [Lachnospiraceae bacterium]